MEREADERALQRAASVLDHVLATASALLACELVAFNRLDGDALHTTRTAGVLPGLVTGQRTPRVDVPCDRLLGGAVGATSEVHRHADYRDVPVVERLRLRTYAGAVVLDADAQPVGTLCGYDRHEVEVDARQLEVLAGLAAVLTPHAEALRRLDAVVARTPAGWRVEGSGDSAAALVGLLSDEPPTEHADDPVRALRLTVHRLEGALQDRVAVEQALGVLAERNAVAPVEALPRLREHDDAGDLRRAARVVLDTVGQRASG